MYCWLPQGCFPQNVASAAWKHVECPAAREKRIRYAAKGKLPTQSGCKETSSIRDVTT